MASANEEYNKQDTVTDDIPEGGDTVDNSYATDKNTKIPVLKDEEPVEQPNDTRDPDSNEALEQDEAEVLDKSKILKGGRTRGANPKGSYVEPGDEEGLPDDDGTSARNGEYNLNQ